MIIVIMAKKKLTTIQRLMEIISHKLTIILTMVLMSGTLATAQTLDQAKSQPIDIFLLIGQSNMAGVAPIEAVDTVRVNDAFLFNDRGEWEVLKNTPLMGLNRYSTVRKPRREKLNLNPGYTFARKMVAYTGKQIGIVSNARGGTRIEWWQKGYTGENDFDLYENAVTRAKAALRASPGASIKGIIWHQGEGDNSAQASALYLQHLQQMVADLRNDLGDSTIFFIAGEVGKWNGRGKNVNPQIRKVAEIIPNADFVYSTGLTSMDVDRNDPHFDSPSQRVLGGRYADKAYTHIYNGKVQGATLYRNPDFAGRSVVLTAGEYHAKDLEGMGISIHEIKSITLDVGYRVKFINDNEELSEIKKNESRLSVGDIDTRWTIRVLK